MKASRANVRAMLALETMRDKLIRVAGDIKAIKKGQHEIKEQLDRLEEKIDSLGGSDGGT